MSHDKPIFVNKKAAKWLIIENIQNIYEFENITIVIKHL